jgi:molecular chaperone Hsp33
LSASHDVIHRFSFVTGPVRGQWVRLREVLSAANGHQPYPDNVAGLLGEMLAAVTLIADGIKFNGTVALQSRGSGPLTTVLAECRSRHLLRGIARWPDSATVPASGSLPELLGNGQLALTLIPDYSDYPGQDRRPYQVPYQGMVGLTEQHLAGNLERYFADSEQLQTRLILAGNRESVTGLLLQRLPDADNATEIELDQNDAFWAEIGLLTATLAPEELTDLAPEPLMRRLYAEYPLTLQPSRRLRFSCSCSRAKTSAAVSSFSRGELLKLLEEQGEIRVTCEICGEIHRFDRIDVHLLFEPGESRIH